MACDSRISDSSGQFFDTPDKIRRINGVLVGCAGNVVAIAKFLEWFERGGERPEFDGDSGVDVLVLRADGIWNYNNSTYPRKVNDKFIAVGSGAGPALGAMHCGVGPAEAVRIAIKCDKHSGGKVRSFTL